MVFPFVIAHLLSSLMTLSLYSVTSVRFYDHHLSRSLLSILMAVSFNRITRDRLCPSNDCLLTSTSPVEHLWDHLSKAVRRCHSQPQTQTLLELEAALQAEWMNIPQVQIQRLIHSMRRCPAYVAPGGGCIKYWFKYFDFNFLLRLSLLLYTIQPSIQF